LISQDRLGALAIEALKAQVKPMAGENLTFHVIVNRPEKSFSIDGPDGPNGVWLHFEMSRVARLQGKQLRDVAMRAPSHETALSEMQSIVPR
jgi:hypothetical protein